MNLDELFEKGTDRLLSFLEKFAILKKIAKTVSILHFYELVVCELDLDSFRVFMDDKEYDEELLSE